MLEVPVRRALAPKPLQPAVPSNSTRAVGVK